MDTLEGRLLDHLVGAGEQRGWNCDAERLDDTARLRRRHGRRRARRPVSTPPQTLVPRPPQTQWRDFLASSLSISRQETERTEQIIQLGFCRAEGIALLPDNG